MRSSVLLAGLLSVVGSSFLSAVEAKIFESLEETPQGWKKLRDPAPSSRIHLRIALQQQNHDLFEQTLFAVSTPGHPRYGKHLKKDELKALIKPKDESTDAVLTWLDSFGIPSADIEDNGEWINFYASVESAEKLLATSFHVYGSSMNGGEKIRTLQYSVPQNVSSHITMIQPTTRFGQMRPQNIHVYDVEDGPAADLTQEVPTVPHAGRVAASCATSITPDCIRSLYNIGSTYATPSKNSLFGVAGYLEEWAKYDQLATFLTKYAPYAKGANFTYELINGGEDTQNDPSQDDGEANLDIQYAVSIGYNTPITYYSTGGLAPLVPDLDQPTQPGSNEPYLDFLNYILALPEDQLPQTITTSYGEDEQSVPASYTSSVCEMFGQLGALGVSILFSSGDTGVGSACQTNDGYNTTRFLPIFPAACPYVTSVGGTSGINPEKAVSFSSGGFSDRFARPSYQDAAVSTYLGILGNQWQGLYNPAGRGFPDVAAQSVSFHVIDEGADQKFSGTSAASPTFAAIISLINNALLAEGKSPLGFLNPWIYSTGYQGLNDITSGGSTGCTGRDEYSGLATPKVPYASWNATKGWDPVTGYGTPNYQKLLALAQG